MYDNEKCVQRDNCCASDLSRFYLVQNVSRDRYVAQWPKRIQLPFVSRMLTSIRTREQAAKCKWLHFPPRGCTFQIEIVEVLRKLQIRY